MKTFKPLIFVLVLAACSGDAVQKDLINYINNELPKVSTLESEAIAAYESISGDNYSTDSAMYYTIRQTVYRRQFLDFFAAKRNVKLKKSVSI